MKPLLFLLLCDLSVIDGMNGIGYDEIDLVRVSAGRAEMDRD